MAANPAWRAFGRATRDDVIEFVKNLINSQRLIISFQSILFVGIGNDFGTQDFFRFSVKILVR